MAANNESEGNSGGEDSDAEFEKIRPLLEQINGDEKFVEGMFAEGEIVPVLQNVLSNDRVIEGVIADGKRAGIDTGTLLDHSLRAMEPWGEALRNLPVEFMRGLHTAIRGIQ